MVAPAAVLTARCKRGTEKFVYGRRGPKPSGQAPNPDVYRRVAQTQGGSNTDVYYHDVVLPKHNDREEDKTTMLYRDKRFHRDARGCLAAPILNSLIAPVHDLRMLQVQRVSR